MDFLVRPPGMLSHDLVSLAFEASDDCIKMLAADGTLLLLNAGGAAAMGFDGPSVPVGQNWIAFWQGEEREAARAALAEAVDGRRSTHRGYLPTATGLPRWWESSLVPLPSAAGELPRVLVISRDVTGRREAERAKRRSERLYRTLVEATSDIVWSLDFETGRWDTSGWTEFTGCACDPARVEDWWGAVHPEDRDRARRDPRNVAREGREHRVEYRLRSKAGGWRWVEDRATPVTDDDGAMIAWIGVVTDVDDRRTAALRLRDEDTKLRLALESASLGTWDVDLLTDECRMSAEARSMIGLTDAEDRCGLVDVLHPEDRDAVIERYRDNIAADAGMTLTTFRIVRPDTGETRWIASRGRSVLDHDGRLVRRVGTFEDFTDRKRTRDALRSTLRRYQALLDATSVIVWHSDASQDCCERQGWTEFTGRSALDSGDAWLDAMHPDDRARVRAIRDRGCDAGRAYLNEYRLSHVDGGHRWVRDDVVPLRADDGSVEGWVGTISDIHERRTAEQALQASEARLRLASEVAGLGTYDVDLATGHREWSPEFHDLIRIPQNASPDRRLFTDAVHVDDRGKLLDDRQMMAEVQDGPRVTTFRLRFETGEVRWMEERERVVLDAEGRPVRRIGTMQDITDRKRVEHELWLAAHADALTGLANRTLFQARLDEAVAGADGRRSEACVLLIDVDRFKEINDTMGHDAGDAVLLAMAERLRHCCPAGATVARLGGDEFGVVMSGERDLTAPDVVGEAILSALRRPVMHEGREIECSGSIGWSAYPHHDGDARALLKNADVALYAAKKAGRNRVASFDAGIREDFERRVTVLRSAKEALARDAVLPFYQPKVSLRTGRVVGFEALLRWRDAASLRGPADLKEAFADPDLACHIGSRILRCVVEDMRGWTERGVPFGHVALNAGAPELHRPGFADGVLQALSGAALDMRSLEIEVTEGVLLDDATTAVTKALKQLDDAGVPVALDDFGTGYASLSHLRRFPVSWLKVDRSFISNMEADNDARTIVRAVIGLAHSLGLKAVAEGVETPSQWEFLNGIGCDLAQGYLIAKPMPAADLPTFLDGWIGISRPSPATILDMAS